MCERVKGNTIHTCAYVLLYVILYIPVHTYVQCMCVETLRVCAAVPVCLRKRGEDDVMYKECGMHVCLHMCQEVADCSGGLC